MNSGVWGGIDDFHPVEAFWPGRFLRYTEESKSAQFSLHGREGSWLPFGSGANLCPGRQFAKIHCILTIAMMVESFQCDVLSGLKELRLDLSKFGMGVLGPSGKITARLRQKDARKV